MELQGKRALVTGGGRGMGAAIATRLAEEGADVVLTYSASKAPAEAIAEKIRKLGRKAEAVAADSRDAGQIKAAVARAGETLGGIDIVVNNSGVFRWGPIDQLSVEDFDESISVNFRSAYVTTKEAMEHMPDGGRICIDGIEQEVAAQGLMRSFIMSRTMSFLRSNDLVYTPAVKSYMMGETPPAFDLLYWNGDGSNLPGKMAMQYLRGLCQRNEFVTTGFPLLGETVHVSDVDVPITAVTCQSDHIAAWKDCYRGFRQTGSKDRTFILSESGHIAGIVNPPSKKKYGHYTNSDHTQAAEDWLEGATYHEGSWWPLWEKWLRKRSGKKVDAREPGDSDYPALAKAPGTYVLPGK